MPTRGGVSSVHLEEDVRSTLVGPGGTPYSYDEPVPTLNTNDSSEREYLPGLTGILVSAVGDTVVYTPPSGKAWILHWAYAVPVTRGAEDAPVITIKSIDLANATIATHYVVAAVSKRKKITMPVDARLAATLDIPGRVPCTFDVEVLP